ncbi:hypothetical protein PMAYCL1PPCAC_00589, partial [Pristionchus mayeri]
TETSHDSHSKYFGFFPSRKIFSSSLLHLSKLREGRIQRHCTRRIGHHHVVNVGVVGNLTRRHSLPCSSFSGSRLLRLTREFTFRIVDSLTTVHCYSCISILSSTRSRNNLLLSRRLLMQQLQLRPRQRILGQLLGQVVDFHAIIHIIVGSSSQLLHQIISSNSLFLQLLRLITRSLCFQFTSLHQSINNAALRF